MCVVLGAVSGQMGKLLTLVATTLRNRWRRSLFGSYIPDCQWFSPGTSAYFACMHPSFSLVLRAPVYLYVNRFKRQINVHFLC